MKLQTEKGIIGISPEVYAAISGYAAMNCFGVKGMAAGSMSDGIVQLLKKEFMTKGVKVSFEGVLANIELHIVVEHGVNITAVSKSIMNEVRYVVERYTGTTVNRINIYVDSIMSD